MEASAVDIEFGDGQFRIVGTDRYGRSVRCRGGRQGSERNCRPAWTPGLDTTQVQNPAGATFPNGCHIAEVEIDPDSGVTTILRYTVVDDFGAVINPLLLEGQVHGGVVQGIGQACWKRRSTTTTPASFSPARSWTTPCRAPTTCRSSHSRPAMYRARPIRSASKGAGEAGAIGAPPALINAIVDALYQKAGVRHVDMPATPRRVWEALRRADNQNDAV